MVVCLTSSLIIKYLETKKLGTLLKVFIGSIQSIEIEPSIASKKMGKHGLYIKELEKERVWLDLCLYFSHVLFFMTQQKEYL
jgi:hypothetical protein